MATHIVLYCTTFNQIIAAVLRLAVHTDAVAATATDAERVQPVCGSHDQEACAANMKHCIRVNFSCANHLMPSAAHCKCTPETPSLRLPWYSMCLTACPVPSIMKHIGRAAISTGKDSPVPLSSVLLPDILTSWYNKYLPGGTVTCRGNAVQPCKLALRPCMTAWTASTQTHCATPHSQALQRLVECWSTVCLALWVSSKFNNRLTSIG